MYHLLVHWSVKAVRRRIVGTGRMRHLKLVQRKFGNGFRTKTLFTKEEMKEIKSKKKVKVEKVEKKEEKKSE